MHTDTFTFLYPIISHWILGMHMYFQYINNITVYVQAQLLIFRPCFFASRDPATELLNDISFLLPVSGSHHVTFLAAVPFHTPPTNIQEFQFLNFQLSLLLVLCWQFFPAINPSECEVALITMLNCGSLKMMMDIEWLLTCLWALNKCKDSWFHIPRIEPFLNFLLSLYVWLHLRIVCMDFQ